MDNKFYYASEGLICPYCKSDKIIILGGNNDIGSMVKCKNCGEIMPENELEEKEKNKEI